MTSATEAIPSHYNVIWEPLKGSQAKALSCPCNHILYEGTRGPGKTDAQIMYFRQFVGVGYGAYWRGVIFDREYKNLDDLIAKSKKWFFQFGDGAQWKAAGKDYKWVWPTGEELLFRQIKKAEEYWNYHGQEFPFIGWNELSKYPDDTLYEAMMSCNRSSFLPQRHSPLDARGNRKILPELPLVVFSTTNPYGPGHNWVKRRFIDPAAPGEVVRKVTNVYNPRTGKREDITKTQVRIFGSYKENIYLSPEYVADLEAITDENKRKAWLYGDWDVVAGGALDDVWGSHVRLPRFPIPESWRIDRSFDWGSTHPFSVGWWAESNGETVTWTTPDGERHEICVPSGSLIRFHEWYGTRDLGSNKGLRLGATAIARRILAIEKELRNEKWIFTKPRAGVADGQIYNVVMKDVATIADQMSEEGVRWRRADKSPGTRKNGLELVRDRMLKSKNGETNGIYFMEHCEASLMLLPTLPRDPDDLDVVDTDAEDHLYDDVRYRVLDASKRTPKSLPSKFPG